MLLAFFFPSLSFLSSSIFGNVDRDLLFFFPLMIVLGSSFTVGILLLTWVSLYVYVCVSGLLLFSVSVFLFLLVTLFFFLLAHLHAVKYGILSHPSSCSKLFFFFFDPSCTSFVLFRTLSLFESRSLSTAPWCNVRFFFYGVSFSFFFFVIEHVL